MPKNIKLYELALTHKSAAVINSSGERLNNERLEFLGDAVLDCIVSDFLYRKFPTGNEGFLTGTRSKIVNGKSLSEIARKMKISDVILTNSTGSKVRMYEDALEAFVGAVYLDLGYKKVQDFIESRIFNKLIDIDSISKINSNHKSILIEWIQKNKYNLEFYTDYESLENKIFISYVRINNISAGVGKGMTKKEAEQNASKETLKIIDNCEIDFEENY